MKKLIFALLLTFAYHGVQAECRYLSVLADCLDAAERGNPIAQFVLGTRYEQGEGVAQDYERAAYWYRKAAAQGDLNAQYNLGVLYFEGKGMAQDYEQAAHWFRKAAEHGLTGLE